MKKKKKPTGFLVSPAGKLSQLSNSTRPLSAAVTHPAQIGFSPDGKVLIVTERVLNNIDTYTVGTDGRAGYRTQGDSFRCPKPLWL